MKPRDSHANSLQENLFQARLDQQLEPKHSLLGLAQQINLIMLKIQLALLHD
jgi:hypothetical protein